jgi:hypothetical protein
VRFTEFSIILDRILLSIDSGIQAEITFAGRSIALAHAPAEVLLTTM